MNYQPTEIKPLKRYPTFQFHAYTDSENLPADDVFKICFLEMCKIYNFCTLERFDADSYYLENQKVIYQHVKE